MDYYVVDNGPPFLVFFLDLICSGGRNISVDNRWVIKEYGLNWDYYSLEVCNTANLFID